MPGPPRKPTKLKILAGRPGHQRVEDREPFPDPAIPDPPPELKGDALRGWNKLAKEMLAVGMLTQLDGGVLAAYCQALERWRRAERQMAKQPLTIMGTAGCRYRNPLLTVIDHEVDRITKLGDRLGLSPAARSRIHVDKKPPKADDLEKFARKRRGKVS